MENEATGGEISGDGESERSVTELEQKYQQEWLEISTSLRDTERELLQIITDKEHRSSGLEDLISRHKQLIPRAKRQISEVYLSSIRPSYGWGNDEFGYMVSIDSDIFNTQISDLCSHFGQLAKMRYLYKIESIETMMACVVENIDLKDFTLAERLPHPSGSVDIQEKTVELEAEGRLIAEGLSKYILGHDYRFKYMAFAAFSALQLLPMPNFRERYIQELIYSVPSLDYLVFYNLPWHPSDLDYLYEHGQNRRLSSPLFWSSSLGQTKGTKNIPLRFFFKMILERGSKRLVRKALGRLVKAQINFQKKHIEDRIWYIQRYLPKYIGIPGARDRVGMEENVGDNLVKAYETLLRRGEDDLADESIIKPLINNHRNIEEALTNSTADEKSVLARIQAIRSKFIRENLLSPEYRQYLLGRYNEWLNENWRHIILTVKTGSLEYASTVIAAFSERIADKQEWENGGLVAEELRRIDEGFIAKKRVILTPED